nr:MAG TPA: hypothetical protein [Caudoviricetes sp.]
MSIIHQTPFKLLGHSSRSGLMDILSLSYIFFI